MLKKLLIGAAAVLSVGGATLATTTPADAAPYGGYHGGYGYRGGWGRGYGIGIGAGLLGVAIGASLASPYYGGPPAYYAGPGYWGYYGGCRGYWRWDPYWGRYVRGARCY
jgi:hypothetical protein